MPSMHRYQLPVEQTGWRFNGQSEIDFAWEYDAPRERLLNLYDKAKKSQWDQATRIDWSTDLDPENPMQLDDRMISINGTEMWQKLTPKEKARVRHHAQAWNVSQLMHGEQGALIATAKIVQMAPDMDAKLYAATQVMDEARHVESYSRLLHEKFELVPTVRDIGLWGPKVQKAYEDMGVMQFADTDIAAKLAADEDWAKELDAAKARSADDSHPRN